jgi:hypothetical protein
MKQQSTTPLGVALEVRGPAWKVASKKVCGPAWADALEVRGPALEFASKKVSGPAWADALEVRGPAPEVSKTNTSEKKKSKSTWGLKSQSFKG